MKKIYQLILSVEDGTSGILIHNDYTLAFCASNDVALLEKIKFISGIGKMIDANTNMREQRQVIHNKAKQLGFGMRITSWDTELQNDWANSSKELDSLTNEHLNKAPSAIHAILDEYSDFEYSLSIVASDIIHFG